MLLLSLHHEQYAYYIQLALGNVYESPSALLHTVLRMNPWVHSTVTRENSE